MKRLRKTTCDVSSIGTHGKCLQLCYSYSSTAKVDDVFDEAQDDSEEEEAMVIVAILTE